MKFNETFTLPMPPQDVARMYTDPSYADVRGRTVGTSRAEAQVSGHADSAFTVTTTLVMSTDRVPDIAKKFVGSEVTVEEVQSWSAPAEDGSRTGTISLTVPGAPVSMSATTRMSAHGGTTSITVDGDLVAKIPLIGGKLEKAALPYISKVLRAEERAAAAYRDRA